MPIKGGQFTTQETEFIALCAASGDPTKAAEMAGYARPGDAATRLSYRPEVQAAIRARVNALVSVQGAPAALACLLSIVRDEKAPKAPRVQAAKVLLDLDREQGGAGGANGSLAEMSRAQLDDARAKAVAWLATLDAGPPVLDLEAQPAPGLFD